MAELEKFEYSNKELVAALLQNRGIHEGHWILTAKLSFSAMNIGESPDGSDASPAGVVALTGIRIDNVPEPLPFSVNAAEANPKK
jgi:hypothetical protein